MKGLAELGRFGMKIPSEYGGLGLSQIAYNRALMLVSTVHASLGALLSAHQSIGVPEPLKFTGSDEQKQKFLPGCAAGAISAFLLTEPHVASDPARLASTATPVEDGGAYELEGVKLWTTNGVVAELLVVMAPCPKAKAIAAGSAHWSSRPTHRASPWSVATSSWDCAHQNGLTRSTVFGCPPRI